MKADGTELQSAPRIISRRPMAPSFRLSASISAATLPEAKEATKASAHGSGSREKTHGAGRHQHRNPVQPAAVFKHPGRNADRQHHRNDAAQRQERARQLCRRRARHGARRRSNREDDAGALLHFFTASIDRYASGRAPISSRRELYVSLSSPRFAP